MDDNELRARLQAADPAREDVPAPSWIDELVETTMTTAQEQKTEQGAPGRPRWVVPAAAAAAVAGIAAVGALAFTGGGDDPADEPTTTQLALPDANAAMQMCIAIDAEVLSTVPVAFDGTVTEIEGEMVTLDVGRWYVGGDADVVELVNPGQADDFAMIEDFLAFEEGKRYYIVAEDGRVSGCLSSQWSAELEGMYAEAFGG
jgi:hypothetical protein